MLSAMAEMFWVRVNTFPPVPVFCFSCFLSACLWVITVCVPLWAGDLSRLQHPCNPD